MQGRAARSIAPCGHCPARRGTQSRPRLGSVGRQIGNRYERRGERTGERTGELAAQAQRTCAQIAFGDEALLHDPTLVRRVAR